MTNTNFSLNSLIILRNLVMYKIQNQKQFKDIKDINELIRLNNKLTHLIIDFEKKIKPIPEYDF